VREGFISMLRGASGLEVVGEANDGQVALELCRRLRPDLILMDVRMPEMDGIEATRAIRAEYPWIGVLIVTSHEDPDYLLEAVRAGAAGFVLKEITKGQLISAIHRTLEGEIPLNQELAMRLITRLSDRVPKEEDQDPASSRADRGPSGEDPSGSAVLPGSLTAREVEVLGLIARGRTNQQIARELLVNISTVKNHIRHILTKLEVSDRTQAAVRAIEAGLLAEGGQE
jgi:DNA-binding NarL/FixJ family response regulator